MYNKRYVIIFPLPITNYTMSLRTPGVYITDKPLPSNIQGAPTSMPVFIGYTKKAENKGKNYTNRPVMVNSLAKYESFFGGAPNTVYQIQASAANTIPDFSIEGKNYSLLAKSGDYLLYNAMQLFYMNGGNQCYVYSIGDYSKPISQNDIITAIHALQNSGEALDASLILVPDAVLVENAEQYGTIAQALLSYCSATQNCFAILDVYNGNLGIDTSVFTDFRNAIGVENLQWGAAYYPFLNTTLITEKNIDYKQIENIGFLNGLLEPSIVSVTKVLEKVGETGVNQHLLQNSPNYLLVAKAIAAKINIQPPSGSIAGIYIAVDEKKGVWSAPANVRVNGVASPVVHVTDEDQYNLGISSFIGKSINFIRTFYGEGVLVWGARTFDGNSLDFRYVHSKRLLIYVEQSIKAAMKAYHFEPNDANTWAGIRNLTNNFLTDLWKKGGLVGATADNAFSVEIGLGTTMTPDDILNGVLRVIAKVALVRPAEFVLVSLEQQQQG